MSDRRNDPSGDAVLASLHAAVTARMADTMGDQAADDMADAIVAQLAYEFGGQQVYFPLRSAYISSLIVEQYTGDNIAELVARFRLSRSAIYNIIQRARAEKKQLEQCRLPGC